jgi:putative Mg2+ transporter-C (MgtC) family protein
MGGELDLQTIFRLLMASVLGGLIGLEREVHGRPAGFRTHLLVSLGSCLFVLASIYFYRLYGNFSGPGPVGVDPGRVAAQVVTGIGFLGGGAIVRDRANIRGLTTAACLWLAAAIGLSCGVGMYAVPAVVTIIALISLLLLKKVENLLKRDNYLEIKVWSFDTEGQAVSVEQVLRECGASIVRRSLEKDVTHGEFLLTFQIKVTGQELACDLVDAVAALDGVKKVALD